MKEPASSESNATSRQRDSVSLRMIGLFFVFFSLLVMLGTFWEDRTRAMVVNVAAGLILLLIGLGMTIYGLRLRAPGSTDP